MSKPLSKQRVGLDMTEGPILKLLLTFALPMVAANLLQQAYSMVDLMVIGKFVGSTGTVAVSTGSEIPDFMTFMATSIATGGQIYIAQLTGAKDRENTRHAISTLCTIALLCTAVCTLLPILLRKPLLELINCPAEAYKEAVEYLVIACLGMVFIFGYNVICSILRGMGESKRPLLFVAIAATVNIVLDVVLVAVFDMGAAGTAIATVASQAGSCIAALVFMLRNREAFGIEMKLSAFFRLERRAVRAIVKQSIPLLVRACAVHGSMLWVKANINVYGVTVSATYSIGNKFEKLIQAFISSTAGAAGSMQGQNIGARKPDRVRRSMWVALALSMAIGVVGAALFLLFPRTLYDLFTNDAAVADFGVVYLQIMSIGCLVAAYSSAFKSISHGAGAAGLSFIIGILDGVCRILVCLFFVHVLQQGAQSYFWGAALCQLLPGIISMFYFLSGRWERKKLLSED